MKVIEIQISEIYSFKLDFRLQSVPFVVIFHALNLLKGELDWIFKKSYNFPLNVGVLWSLKQESGQT